MLERYDAVMAIMLPSLREERQQSYSPFLPVHPKTGIVMQVPIDERKLDAGTIVWRDPETGERFETPVTGGHAKLQWKPDWAMRWVALGVDYEMAGKDLIDSVKLSGEIAKALGGLPPDGFNYELFLDEKGQKISKSKGNGLTIDEWLTYGTPDSLRLFMFNKPREAKKLYFDVIPRQVDDYLTFLEKYPAQDAKARLMNPVWHLHAGEPPAPELVVSGRRQPARHDDLLLHAAQPRGGGEFRGSGGALGLHPPLCAGRLAGDASAPRQPREARRALLRGFREAAEDLSSGGRGRGRIPARAWTRCSAPSSPGSGPRPPRRSRKRSTMSAAPSRAIRISRPRARRPSGRACPSSGSTRSIRCCSASRAARASARSWRSTA